MSRIMGNTSPPLAAKHPAGFPLTFFVPVIIFTPPRGFASRYGEIHIFL
jgi:hypothetical protein